MEYLFEVGCWDSTMCIVEPHGPHSVYSITVTPPPPPQGKRAGGGSRRTGSTVFTVGVDDILMLVCQAQNSPAQPPNRPAVHTSVTSPTYTQAPTLIPPYRYQCNNKPARVPRKKSTTALRAQLTRSPIKMPFNASTIKLIAFDEEEVCWETHPSSTHCLVWPRVLLPWQPGVVL